MRFPLLAMAFALAPALALADPAQTVVPTVMRAAPSPKARVVQSVPANADIELSSCRDAWCYVSWRNAFGYVPVSTVEAGPYGRPAPVYGPPPVVVAPFGWGWGPRRYYGPGWHHHW